MTTRTNAIHSAPAKVTARALFLLTLVWFTASAWALTPATSVQESDLYGSWVAVIDTLELVTELNPDGTYRTYSFDYSTQQESRGQGFWRLEGEDIIVDGGAGPVRLRRYRLEALQSAGGEVVGLRFIGSANGIFAPIHRRFEPATAVSYIPAAWFWTRFWRVTSPANVNQTWYFSADGRYQVDQLDTFGNVLGSLTGDYTLINGAELIFDPNEANEYALRVDASANGNFSGVDGQGNQTLLASRGYFWLEESGTITGDDYEGIYVSNKTTLTLTHNGGGQISGDLLFQGQRYPFSGTATNNILRGSIPGLTNANVDMSFQPNGLYDVDSIATGFPAFLRKLSSTPLPTPPANLTGYWMNENLGASTDVFDDPDDDFATVDTLSLLPDGRFLQTFGISGSEFSGDYTLINNQLTLVGVCSAASYTVTRQDNQLILTDANNNRLYYHYVPNGLSYSEGVIAARAEDNANRDDEWAQRLFLAPIAPAPSANLSGTFGPLGLPVTADPASNTIYPGARVFGALQYYQYQSPTSYSRLISNPFEVVSFLPSELAFDEQLANDILDDASTYKDRSFYAFLPNGRVLIRFESFVNPAQVQPTLLPQVDEVWGRYRIEGDNLIIDAGGEQQVVLARGRRTLRDDQFCHDQISALAEPREAEIARFGLEQIHRRYPTPAEVDQWRSVLQQGTSSEQFINALLSGQEYQTIVLPIGRLYTDALGRFPDADGLAYWIGIFLAFGGNENALALVADQFPASPEFIARFGANLPTAEYVDRLYQNVLKRPADEGGKTYWTGVFDQLGASRGAQLLVFSGSPENNSTNGPTLERVLLFRALLDRDPLDSELAESLALSLSQVVNRLINSDEYAGPR